ncbi:glycosyl hydrolase family 92-domain-containing protein [Aspergillus floccosus]
MNPPSSPSSNATTNDGPRNPLPAPTFTFPNSFTSSRLASAGVTAPAQWTPFVAMTMMGLLPNRGQNVHLILAPFFESMSIKLPLTGKTTSTRAVNFDPQNRDVYIQSTTLDGQSYTKHWLGHNIFTERGKLVVLLGK